MMHRRTSMKSKGSSWWRLILMSRHCRQLRGLIAIMLFEAKIKEDKIKDLLSKYWNLRPSNAARFLYNAKDIFGGIK